MDRPHCVFRKPVMGSGFPCRHASLCHTPMGCSVLCGDLAAYDHCQDMLDTLIHAGRFALGFTPDTDSLTHGKLMKVQHGGLLGMNRALNPDREPADIKDISQLIDSATKVDLPLQDIIAEMRQWQNRRRGRK